MTFINASQMKDILLKIFFSQQLMSTFGIKYLYEKAFLKMKPAEFAYRLILTDQHFDSILAIEIMKLELQFEFYLK